MDDPVLQGLKHKATILMSAARDNSCTTARIVAEGAYFKAHAAVMAAVSAEEVDRQQTAFTVGQRQLRSAMYASGR